MGTTQEELARIGATTAVGRTSALTASLEFDGAAIAAVTAVEADLTQLESDDSRRDRTLERQGVETNSFPTASFVLTVTEPIVLDAAPEEGVPIAATALGELTLHGVTRPVEVALEGQLVGGLVVVIGSTAIEFADYELEAPSAVIVLSIGDRSVMELQLIFERA